MVFEIFWIEVNGKTLAESLRAVSWDPYCSLFFINDMSDLVHHILKLFADYSKLIALINNNTDIYLLQSDNDALVNWAADFNWKNIKYIGVQIRVFTSFYVKWRKNANLNTNVFNILSIEISGPVHQSIIIRL